jgi:hypothetical protein
MLFKIIIISLFKSISFGSIYLLQPYLHNFNINTLYIDKLNILLISMFLIKFYICYNNYIKIFKLLENIYSSSKYLLTLYTIFINYTYIDDSIDDSDEISINISIDNIQYNKKLQITHIKDLMILYISISLSSIFKLKNQLISYLNNKQLVEYLNNEVKHINNSDNNTHILLSLIELLILKNFNDLYNLNHISKNDQHLLINSFKNLQNNISELSSLNNNNLYDIIKSLTYIILFFNITIIYMQYLNNDIYSFIVTIIINFIIIFIDDILNVYSYIYNILSNIFDFDTYIKEINEDIYMMNYLSISNKEYIL